MTGYELIKLCICFDFGRSHAVAKSTLVGLASFYNEQSDAVWPSESSLRSRVSAQREAMFKAIAWLEEMGLISVSRCRGKGNYYTFNTELLKSGRLVCARHESTTRHELMTRHESVTQAVMNPVLHPSRIHDTTRHESMTLTKKEQRKNKKGTNEVGELVMNAEFSLMPTAPVKSERQPLTHLFDYEELPNEWRLYCEQVRPDLNPDVVFTTVKAYWTMGKGSGTRRSNKGWSQAWINWVRREREPSVNSNVEKEITAETITDKQAGYFASVIAHVHSFASRFANSGEGYDEFIKRIALNMKKSDHFEQYKPYLIDQGLIRGE